MQIQQATPEMFEDIYDVLREFRGALKKEDWRRLLDYRFSDQRYRGWVSLVQGKIVGYLGAIFSRRGDARICGLTSWITRSEHRKSNLRILTPMLELKDHTLLNLSASPFTAALFRERLGFSVLDEHVVVLPPLVPQLTPRGWQRARELDVVLSPEQLKLYSDHAPYHLTHLAFAGPQGHHLYVVASRTRFRRLNVSYLHFVSDPARFARIAGLVQRELADEHGTLVTVVDARLLGDEHVRGSFRWRLAQPRLYRPGAPAPQKTIDSLYTELVVLNPARWSFVH
jgi:hypothetical protein